MSTPKVRYKRILHRGVSFRKGSWWKMWSDWWFWKRTSKWWPGLSGWFIGRRRWAGRKRRYRQKCVWSWWLR